MLVLNPFLNRVFSTSVFYLGWIICLQEATIEGSYYGLFIVLGFIAYFLLSSNSRKADCLLMSCVLLIGPLSDMLYSYLGLLHYHSVYQLNSLPPPLWVFMLWGLFGANIHLFSWLTNRWFLSSIFGAIGGFMSYLSVVKLGGATLQKPLLIALLTIGGAWSIFFPFFIWLEKYLKKKF